LLTDKPLKTPVLFLVFNRPDETQRVFDEIRKAKPKKLFIAADGPREGKHGEAEKCQAVRDITGKVDWECDVRTNFQKTNVGLKLAITSSIDWFFEHVDEGIILEDDCLPSQSFFWFCQELLERYHDDDRIMQISGSNFLFGRRVSDASYFFAKLNDIWGWATWKRAWKHYDVHMKSFPQFKEQDQLQNYIDDPEVREWLMSYFEQDFNAAEKDGLWSSQWVYAMCVNNGLTIAPCVNFVTQIGVEEGTHVASSYRLYSTVGRCDMDEIIHPPFILPSNEADRLRFEVIRKTDPRLLYARWYRIRNLAKKYLPKHSHRVIKQFINSLKFMKRIRM